MPQAPSFPFYPRDWVDELDAQSLQLRGAWITILAKAWMSPVQGVVCLTPRQWARVFGEKVKDAMAIIAELGREGICDLYLTHDRNFVPQTARQDDVLRGTNSGHVPTFSDDVPDDVPTYIAVVSRRMFRQEKSRAYEREKKRKQRDVPDNVPVDVPACPTAPSFSSSFSSSSPNGESEVSSGVSDAPKTAQGQEDEILVPQSSGTPACPHQRIIDLYHELLPELPVVKVWSDQRKKLLKTRWAEKKERQSLDYWRKLFALVRTCPWLMGEVESRDGRRFQADLEWLIRPTNFAKLIEGRYKGDKKTVDDKLKHAL